MSRENNAFSDAPFRAREAWSRANDILSAGTSRTEKTIALRALHEPLAGKRKVTSWHPILERIMQLHLDLCVELNSLTLAQDALDAYKKLTQNVNTASLNEIITKFVSGLNSKLNQSNTSAQGANILQECSLEEALRCASYVDEDYREMIDRRKQLPQESRTWEAHRFSIEILRANPKLMQLYLTTIQKGAHFCLEHRRKSDLRDLIRLTRKSVERTQRLISKEEDMRKLFLTTPDIYYSILDTWIKLFEVAASSSMVMWPEAYKIVEYLNFTMQEVFFGMPSKPHHLIAYSEAVVKVFGASTVGPHELYHSYALFYLWRRKKHMNIADADLPNQVLLAALRISKTEEKTTIMEKTSLQFSLASRWMQLLSLKYKPTWESVLSEVQHIKHLCDERVQRLADILSQPVLTVAHHDAAYTLLESLKGSDLPGCKEYIETIRTNALKSMVSTFARSYASIRMDVMARICHVPNFYAIESIVLKAAAARKEPILIDEKNGIVHFHRRSMDQATATVSNLRCAVLSMSDIVLERKEKPTLQKLVQDAVNNGREERQQILLRLELIEKRRIARDAMSESKRVEEHQKKLLKDQQEREEAVLKFAKERNEREVDKKKQIEKQLELEKARDLLVRLESTLNKKFEPLRSEDDRKVLLEKMLGLLADAQQEMSQNASNEVKKHDYFVRALREAEAPLLVEQWAKTRAELEAEYEQRRLNQLEMSERNAANAAETRDRLQRMNPQRLAWQRKLLSIREGIVKDQTRKRINEQRIADQLAAGAAKSSTEVDPPASSAASDAANKSTATAVSTSAASPSGNDKKGSSDKKEEEKPIAASPTSDAKQPAKWVSKRAVEKMSGAGS